MKYGVAIWVALVLVLSGTGGVLAHSLASFQETLGRDEPFYKPIDLKTPGFELVDENGAVVGNGGFHGRVVILYFVCAGCDEFLPEQGEMISRLQEMVNISAMRDLVQFVGIAEDHGGERGEFAGSYREKYGLDRSNWMLLFGNGGQRGDVARLKAEFSGQEQAEGQGTAIHIIGMKGRWSGYFTGFDFNPTNLIILVNALTNVDSAENDGHQDEDEAGKGFWANPFGIFGGGS